MRANGEGTYYHDKKRNNWQYKLSLGYDNNGFPVRKTFYGKTRDAARRKGQDYKKKLEDADMTTSPDIKLKKWAQIWLKTYKLGTIKQTSYHQLELLVDKIPEHIKNKKVSDVSLSELQAFINEISLIKSKSYTDKMKVTLRSIFTEAQDNGFCVRNPARRLKSPKKAEVQRKIYSIDECSQILEFADNYSNQLIATGIVILLFTGLRRGELLGLKWEDILSDSIFVNRSVFLDNNKPVAIDNVAKTAKSIRCVPINSKIYEYINRLPKNGDYVFGSTVGGLMYPRNFNRAYDIFFSKMKSSYPDIVRLSPHHLRHTYITNVVNGCSDISVAQLLAGHTDIKTTSRYTHPHMEKMRVAVDSMMDLFNKDISKDNM